MGSPSGLLTRNWTLKASAFGVALLLWVAVRAEAPNEGDAVIPVRVDVTDPAWILVGEPMPNEVTVHFGATVSELVRMTLDPPPIVIPVDRVSSTDTVVVLRTAWVRVGADVVPASVDPPTVRITLERVDRTAVPARVTYTGELPQGLAMAADPSVDPPEIRVAGPRSGVARLTEVPLVALDLSRLAESGVLDVAVDTTHLPAGLTIQPRSVRVDVRLAERVDREVIGVPVVLPADLAPDSSLRVRPATVTVVLSGSRAMLDALDTTRLRLIPRGTRDQLASPGGEVQLPADLTGLPAHVSGRPRQEGVWIRTGGESPR